MNIRRQITLDSETQRRAEARAAELGISFAEYVRRAIADDLGPPASARKVDVTSVFNLVTDGPPTEIARDKDKMLGEAVWQEHLRKTGGQRRRSAQSKPKRR